jgi:hypothetical protein
MEKCGGIAYVKSITKHLKCDSNERAKLKVVEHNVKVWVPI